MEGDRRARAHRTEGFEGRFREVVPPERIVQTFEWDGMPGDPCVATITLEELGHRRTRMVNRTLFHIPAERDPMLTSGMEAGANQSYEMPDRVLAAMG